MVRHLRRRQLSVRRRRTHKVAAAIVVAVASFAITVAACLSGPAPHAVDDASVERVIQGVASGSACEDDLTSKVLQEATVQTSDKSASVRDQATCELERLCAEPRSVLARAGYMDLRGSVWSCTATGDGWVEIVVLSEGGEGGCRRQCVRMEREQWERIMRSGA